VKNGEWFLETESNERVNEPDKDRCGEYAAFCGDIDKIVVKVLQLRGDFKREISQDPTVMIANTQRIFAR
jgi:hypothetical protein